MNFALKNYRNRKFRFGQTTRIHTDILIRTISDSFANLRNEHESRDTLLMCHGVQNELRILDDIGVRIEDLPIIGILDALDTAAMFLDAAVVWSICSTLWTFSGR